MKITLEALYDFGDIVYSKTDPDQEPRIIVGYCLRPDTALLYDVQCKDKVVSHYGFEITKEPTLIK